MRARHKSPSTVQFTDDLRALAPRDPIFSTLFEQHFMKVCTVIDDLSHQSGKHHHMTDNALQ